MPTFCELISDSLLVNLCHKELVVGGCQNPIVVIQNFCYIKYKRVVQELSNNMLATEKTYSETRQHLSSTLNDVADNNAIVVIKRRNRKDVALIAADELSSLMETVHLLRSPKNARRLLDALEQSKNHVTPSMTVEELKQEIGIVE